jgi:GAF domain-containing protein
MHPPAELLDGEPLYASLCRNLQALIAGEQDWLVNTANCASLIYQLLPDLNWAGFYFVRNGQLVLGPFQGKPACMRIELGRGVCGTAAQEGRTIIVADVQEFPGHIACDAASKSEIVIPLFQGTRLLGVLDLDSPRKSRFTAEDASGLQALAKILIEGTGWNSLPQVT